MTVIRRAKAEDISAIVAALAANRTDASLFLRSKDDVESHLEDFLVAEDTGGRVVGCAAVHLHDSDLAELLSVAIFPDLQGRGIGGLLISGALRVGHERGIRSVWLATSKPAYFARFGFSPISRWRLPAHVLVAKLRQVLKQPIVRWGPALAGRFTFMHRQLDQESS